MCKSFCVHTIYMVRVNGIMGCVAYVGMSDAHGSQCSNAHVACTRAKFLRMFNQTAKRENNNNLHTIVSADSIHCSLKNFPSERHYNYFGSSVQHTRNTVFIALVLLAHTTIWLNYRAREMHILIREHIIIFIINAFFAVFHFCSILRVSFRTPHGMFAVVAVNCFVEFAVVALCCRRRLPSPFKLRIKFNTFVCLMRIYVRAFHRASWM